MAENIDKLDSTPTSITITLEQLQAMIKEAVAAEVARQLPIAVKEANNQLLTNVARILSAMQERFAASIVNMLTDAKDGIQFSNEWTYKVAVDQFARKHGVDS